jgi:hypothetical protein
VPPCKNRTTIKNGFGLFVGCLIYAAFLRTEQQ